MKTLKKSILVSFSITLMVFFIQNIFAANTEKNLSTIKIRTSAVCDMCKQRIEKNLSYEKGVKSATLDISTKIVTVEYDNTKTNPDKIRLAISKTGYDADNIKADKAAYERLPNCCKKAVVIIRRSALSTWSALGTWS